MIKHNFKQLKLWQKARALNIKIFMVTSQFPKHVQHTLTYQMTKSSLSIMSNIAEGSASGSDANFLRYLNISMGSTCELESQTIASEDLGLLDGVTFNELIDDIEELKKMNVGFQKSLK